MLFKLFLTIIREMLFTSNFKRQAEPEMLMEDALNVQAYDIEGQEGVLLGVYYYQIAQMCAIIKPRDIVVDLGCGPCNLLCILAKLNPDVKFIGVDLSTNMLQQAKRNILNNNIHNIELLCDDITNITQLKSQSIDVIISSMAIHHLPSVEALESLFIEINRLLKSEKRLYIYDFGKVNRIETINFFLSTVRNKYVKEDYKNSLIAAFKVKLFRTFSQKYLGKNIDIYYTRPAHIIVVIKSPSDTITKEQKEYIKNRILQFNSQQKKDYYMLKCFLSLNGLRSQV